MVTGEGVTGLESFDRRYWDCQFGFGGRIRVPIPLQLSGNGEIKVSSCGELSSGVWDSGQNKGLGDMSQSFFD